MKKGIKLEMIMELINCIQDNYNLGAELISVGFYENSFDFRLKVDEWLI